MNFLTLNLDVKAEGEAGQFTGLASTYGGEPDAYGDVVLPGAFTDTLAKRGREIPILWAHDTANPVGLGELSDSVEGLRIKGQLDLDTQAGRDAFSRVKKRIVQKLSIGYRVAENGAQMKGNIRQLSRIELFEVSLVTLAANESARITAVKAEITTIRAFEQFLHQAGWSRSEAKRLASHGWAGLGVEDEPPEAMAEYMAWLKERAA